MAGFNHCVFVGRVGIDPELRQTNEGVSYCRFRLAVDQGKDALSQRKRPLFFKAFWRCEGSAT